MCLDDDQQQNYDYSERVNRFHVRSLSGRNSNSVCVREVGLDASPMRTSAATSLRYRFAHRHMPRSGEIIVRPRRVSEYSTATVFARSTLLVINPVSSSLRSDLVSMRCDTLASCRRSSPWRWGLSSRENKIRGVHLPIKISSGVANCCVVFMFGSAVLPVVPVSIGPAFSRPRDIFSLRAVQGWE